MQLADLDILQNVTPKWGAGHYLARHQNGDLLEVLVAERSSESVTSLLSWAHALERVSHPSIPEIQTIVHQETTFVALKVNEGLSLSQPIQNDRDQLDRLDILSAFYQLATALKKLHDHGLNHGNLTLDHMKFIGEGYLQLRGWAPPAIETTFPLRQLDELKRFKNFFYLAIVGQFAPANRNKHSLSDQKMTPFQIQCLDAWGQWYHEESKRPSPNLSTSHLMLFDEPPKDAQELIDELTPYLDHSIAQFYESIGKELERRESFETLYVKRLNLLSELERTHRATELWLQQQESNKILSDQQGQQIEKMVGDLDQLQGRLESLGGYIFKQSQKFLTHSPRLQNRGAHTQLYDLESPPSNHSSTHIQTLGGSLKALDDEWQYVNPNRPIYISQDEQQLLPSQNFLHQDGSPLPTDRLSLNHMRSGGLIDWAELPPLVLSEAVTNESSDQNLKRPSSLSNRSSEQLSALGLEPLPSQVNIPSSLAIESDRQATQLYTPRHHNLSLLDVGIEHSEVNLSMIGMSALVPGKTRTAFTEHLSEFDGADFYNPQNDHGPKLAFSHRNFFTFLYVTAALVFIWSLRSQDETVISSTSQTNSLERVGTQQAGVSTQLSTVETNNDSIENQIKQETVTEYSSEDVILEKTPPPSPPANMVFIPGGMVNDSLSEEAYNQVVRHCMYEPNYKGRDHRKKESCKRLIRKPKSEPKQVHVAPFFIDIYEVSRGEYQQYCRDGGVCDQRVHYSNEELSLPVIQVSMIQAMDYCRFYKKTLPSYEQWLFAARGESEALYPWGNDDVLNGRREYRANYKSKLSKARRRRKSREIDGYRGVYSVRKNTQNGLSPFGVAHLAGNVREWVSRDRRRLGWVTGGSWKQPIWSLRLTSGEFLDQYVDSSDDIGFRCAQDIEN